MNLLVFPSDPLNTYIDKGEIKSSILTSNIFKEITFITVDTKKVEPSNLKYATGSAKIKILYWKRLNYLEQLFPHFRKSSLLKLIEGLEIDIIRGFSPFHSGFFAVQASTALNAKVLLSIHSNFDQLRFFYLKDIQILRFIKYWALSYSVEKTTLNRADLLQPAYKFAEEYCKAKVHNHKKIKTVYNRVYSTAFFLTSAERK